MKILEYVMDVKHIEVTEEFLDELLLHFPDVKKLLDKALSDRIIMTEFDSDPTLVIHVIRKKAKK